MQGVYFLKDNVLLEKSHSAELAIFHDEYSWSFDISAGKQNKFSEVNRPSCDCWFHLVNSRNRIGQLNDNFNRNKKFMKFFEQMDFQKEDCVLVLGDNSFLGALLGKTVGKVYIIEENSLGKKVMNNFIQYNSLQEKVEVLDNLENVEVSNKVTHIFTEPHFLSASLPWDHITILFNKLKSLSSILDLTTIKHISQSARILAVPVHFLHLYKIRHPLVQCESFDHTIFDDFVEHASSIADKNTETFSLWEYPCIALGPSACLMNFDLTGKTEQKMKEKIELFIQR